MAAAQLCWLPPMIFTVWLCEMVVDWIKHAFITKFNGIAAHTVGPVWNRSRAFPVACRKIRSVWRLRS